jgi:hypothetical protein
LSSDTGKRTRAPRADALRNPNTLIQVARAAFGAAADTVSLEGIA